MSIESNMIWPIGISSKFADLRAIFLVFVLCTAVSIFNDFERPDGIFRFMTKIEKREKRGKINYYPVGVATALLQPNCKRPISLSHHSSFILWTGWCLLGDEHWNISYTMSDVHVSINIITHSVWREVVGRTTGNSADATRFTNSK